VRNRAFGNKRFLFMLRLSRPHRTGAMTCGMVMRLLVAVILIAAEVAAGTTLLMVAPTPAEDVNR
jgi:uncharacterized membrane protein YjgN (DUF898 family)